MSKTTPHSPRPPQWADRFVHWCLSEEAAEEVVGDLHELFDSWVNEIGVKAAKRRYMLNALGFVRPLPKNLSKRNKNAFQYEQSSSFITPAMFSNYLKIAWRNLLRSKGYSVLNILGLATGIGVALLIGLWIHYHYSYDRFIPKYQQLYQVMRNFNSNGDTLTFSTSSLKLANALRTGVPEIARVAESDYGGSHGLMSGNKKLYVSGLLAGSDFLNMFQYPLVQGNAQSVLHDPYSIVLTEATAKALFGAEEALNKVVRFDNEHDLKVTGVLKDLPANSTFSFKFLVPFAYYEQTNEYVKKARSGSYGENSFQIFVELKPGVSMAHVATKLRDIEKTEIGSANAMNSQVILQPLKNWHLYSPYKSGKVSGGFIEYIRMFGIIGVLVLLIACINFINLTTARSEKRAREVGVRKAIGSERKDLILQFLTESFLFTLIAFAVSLLLVWMALPYFNTLTNSKTIIPFSSVLFWLMLACGVMLTGLLAGSRPAFYLSSFQAVKVLKGTFRTGKGGSLSRKVLVVVQFSCSIALVISTMIIYQQIHHAQERPTGYQINRLLMTNMNTDMERNFVALKNELLQEGIVEMVTMASSPVTNIWSHTDIDTWPGKNAGETVEMGKVVVGEDYFKTLGIAIVEGKDFINSNDTTSVVFNEAAVKRLRLKIPLNQVINWNGQQYRIAGVAKDALMISPFAAAEPMMFLTSPNSKSVMIYRIAAGVKTVDALSRLTEVFSKYSPAFPYDYQFADQSYAEKFNLEILIGRLAGVFAALAIFISCLGLFGLAAYIAEQRTKEIGIRKVLGASVSQLWLLLSKDFVVLVTISCLIASPTAFYFLQHWLQKYEYRITIGAGVFIGAALMALSITLVTISFQAMKAAVADPVKSLRTE